MAMAPTNNVGSLILSGDGLAAAALTSFACMGNIHEAPQITMQCMTLGGVTHFF